MERINYKPYYKKHIRHTSKPKTEPATDAAASKSEAATSKLRIDDKPYQLYAPPTVVAMVINDTVSERPSVAGQSNYGPAEPKPFGFYSPRPDPEPSTSSYTVTPCPEPLLSTSSSSAMDLTISSELRERLRKPPIFRKRSLKLSGPRGLSVPSGPSSPFAPTTQHQFSLTGTSDYLMPFKPMRFVPPTDNKTKLGINASDPYALRPLAVATTDYNTIEEILNPRFQRKFNSLSPSRETDAELLLSFSKPIDMTTPRSIEIPNSAPVSIEIPNSSPIYLSKPNDVTAPVASTSTQMIELKFPPTFHVQQPFAFPPIDSAVRTPKVDFELLLCASVWYRDLPFQEKLVVNQTLGRVSSELNHFHANTNPDKRLNVTAYEQDMLLTYILNNLGVYITNAGMIQSFPKCVPPLGVLQHYIHSFHPVAPMSFNGSLPNPFAFGPPPPPRFDDGRLLDIFGPLPSRSAPYAWVQSSNTDGAERTRGYAGRRDNRFRCNLRGVSKNTRGRNIQPAKCPADRRENES